MKRSYFLYIDVYVTNLEALITISVDDILIIIIIIFFFFSEKIRLEILQKMPSLIFFEK